MFLDKRDYKTNKDVKKEYPNKIIIACCNGWMAFDSIADLKIWQNQK